MAHRPHPPPNFDSEKRLPSLYRHDHEHGDSDPLGRPFISGDDEPQAHRQSLPITSWRGLVPCLVIFLLTGLLIFSNRVQLTEGMQCLQREGIDWIGDDGIIEPSQPPSSQRASFHDNLIKSRLRFPLLGSAAEPRQDEDASSKLLNSRSPQLETASTTSSAATPTRTVLRNFQVAQPVLMPYGASDSDGTTDDDGSLSQGECKVLLMRRDFAWSYNDPFIGNYTPPNCEFNRVVINFTVVSHGRQYDRLALMYLGDTEVWRTSTSQPTIPPGIRWVYMKDMTEYLYFWKQPQKLIFDLGNLINEKYTGIFNTTLTATFFMSDVVTDTAPPSDLIIPISARQSANNSVSQFTIPAQEATNTIADFPRNARRAVFSVSANGQASEEFWWSNVPQSDTLTFNSTAGELPGYSPFREVQVLIDGQLAGVQWPFPVIFTGGVSPGLHRPIASTDAHDLKEHEIDITPFLPLLCDGKPHTFSIIVAGLNDDGKGQAELIHPVNENWYVTGKIFVWLDEDPNFIPSVSSVTPIIQAPPPAISLTRSLSTVTTPNGTLQNSSLIYTTTVQRTLLISSTSKKGTDSVTSTWSQTLSYTNKGYVSSFGFNQVNDLTISGLDTSSSSSPSSPSYTTQYTYPLFANSSYSVTPQGNLTIWAHVIQSKHLATTNTDGKILPGRVFPMGLEAFNTPTRQYTGSVLNTTKQGQAWFFQSGDGMNSSGFGDAYQTFRFGGHSGRGILGDEASIELYWRNVSAANGSIIWDHKRLAGGVGGPMKEEDGTPPPVGNGGRGMGFFPQIPTSSLGGGGTERVRDGRVGLRSFMGRNDT